MKFLHFASSLQGGANIAGLRLHKGLLSIGAESVFFHGAGSTSQKNFIGYQPQRSFCQRNLVALNTSYWARQWKDEGFVVGNQWIIRTEAPDINYENAVVCLHWVSRWLDLPAFLSSLPPGTPVIWTLHDLIPITGGCSNPYECTKYEVSCGTCPQLANPSNGDMSSRFHKQKMKLFESNNVHLVANSDWTYGKACASTLGKVAKSITKIHYGLELDQFCPVPKEIARKSLRLSMDDRIVIGFSCLDFNDERKGARTLLEAFRLMPEDVRKRCVLLILGGGTWPDTAPEMDVISIGSVSDHRLQSIFYSALDFFVLPSKSETFGLVVIEALACETPVVAFDCGGPSDTVRDGVTGSLVSAMRPQALAVAMVAMVHEPNLTEMGKEGRRDVEKRFSNKLMAEKYIQLVESITDGADYTR